MIALLLDQGLPVGAARALRDRGWDAIHVSERGLCRATDVELLRLAAREERVIVTLDADFPMIVALERRERPSVVHLRIQPMDRDRCIRILEELVPNLLEDLGLGAMISVQERGVRVRRLPLR